MALFVLLAAAVALTVSTRNSGGTPAPTPSPTFDTAERVARQWLQSRTDLVAVEVSKGAFPQLPFGVIERTVLRDNVRKHVSRDSNWKTSLGQEVIEVVYRVPAAISFPAGLVNPPAYSITATYLIAVDTKDRTVKDFALLDVTVIRAQ